MGEIGKRNLANAILAGAILIGLAHFGLTETLGAHPNWAVKVAYIGVGFGVVIYSMFWVWQGGWLARLLAFIGLTGVTSAVTILGKMRFVGSYGEDALGGQLWYFGWIAVIGFVFALLMHVLSARP